MDWSDPWVQAALKGTLDRAAYARALGDDPRGQLLRLLLADQPDPRIAALREQVDETWLKLFAPPSWILGCRARSEPLQMAVECDQQWAELAPTDRADVRHCAKCATHVYQVTTRAEAERRARAGQCISAIGRAAEAVHASTPDGVVGRPHAPTHWARRVLGS